MRLGSRVFAAMYDRAIAGSEQAGLGAMRARLVGEAAGDVLEIGAGTGANLGYYGDAVATLTLTEPEPAMLKRLERRVAVARPTARILRASGEDLPFEDESFDTVVSTLVLCGVDDQQRTLREVRRVLRAGGRLLFIEHVRSPDASVARRQDRMNGINRIVARCECNRRTLLSIGDAGLRVGAVEDTFLPKAPSFAAPAIVGSAVRDAAERPG
jgi:ubiquinone/menaquinone biosynthesis C-methylase UbiE